MAATLDHSIVLLGLNGLKHVEHILLRRLLDAFNKDSVAILAGERKKLLSVNGIGEKDVKFLAH